MKATDGGTSTPSGIEARAGWINAEEHEAAYKPRFDVPPANRKARRAAAAKARRG